MKTTLILGFVTVCLALSAGPAFALGTSEMSEPADVIEIYSYDVELVATRSVMLTLAGGNRTEAYRIGFSSGQSGNPAQRRLYAADGSSIPYRVVDSVSSGNDLKDLNDQPSQTEMLSGSISSGQTETRTFDILIPGGGVPAPGTYSDMVTLSAYDSRGRVADSSLLNVSVVVPAVISLSVTPPGGAFDPDAKSYLLDFGILETGDRGYLDMIVRSNDGYTIEFTSANNGRFAHTDPRIPSYVPYTFRVDSSPLPLGSGSAVVSGGSGPTGPAGRRHAIDVEIGDIDAAFSGVHRDTIQVTVFVR